MKITNKLLAVIIVLLVVALGFTIFYNFKASSLIIERESYFVDEAPVGHILKLSGMINQTILLTQEVSKQDNTQLPLLEGNELKKSGFYWAGIQDDLIFIQKDNNLQVQRQISEETGTVHPKEVLMTMELPKNTIINFK